MPIAAHSPNGASVDCGVYHMLPCREYKWPTSRWGVHEFCRVVSRISQHGNCTRARGASHDSPITRRWTMSQGWQWPDICFTISFSSPPTHLECSRSLTLGVNLWSRITTLRFKGSLLPFRTVWFADRDVVLDRRSDRWGGAPEISFDRLLHNIGQDEPPLRLQYY